MQYSEDKCAGLLFDVRSPFLKVNLMLACQHTVNNFLHIFLSIGNLFCDQNVYRSFGEDLYYVNMFEILKELESSR